MSDLKYFEKIEAFIEGKLSDSERRNFEKEMTENAELKHEYESYLATLKAVELLGFDQLKNEINKREKEETQRVLMPQRRWMGIAASLIVLVAAALFHANSKYSDTRIFADYYKEPNLTETRGEGSAELFKIATDAFYRNNFDRTIELLDPISEGMPGYVEAKYILGHAYLKNGQPDKAKDAFLKVANAPENEWTKSAKWHLVLASLQSGDERQAIQFLDEIIESNYDEYVDLAKRLKADLESPWRVLVFD